MNDEERETGNFEESEEERAYLEFVCELQDKNRSRYEAQAKLLLKNKELRMTIHDSLLMYSIEDHGCASRISRDGGFDFSLLGWRRLERNKDEVLLLTWEFAKSEARAITEK